MSGKSRGVAEGPMNSKAGRAVSVLRILGAELSTHYLREGRAAKES
jgi:hypothetical protein